MKVFFITSGGEKRPEDDFDWCVLFDDVYASKVIRHLKNDPSVCSGCAAACNHCRDKLLKDHSENIVGELKLPRAVLFYVDRPSMYLPDKLPAHDVCMAINIHEDILLALPGKAAAAGAKAIIAPVEDPEWVSRWTRDELYKRCREAGIEAAVPKPGCALTKKESHPFINEFMDYFKIGQPEVEIRVNDKGKITRVDVIRGAPCGDTWYVAHNLIGKEVSEIEKHVAKFWHAYPCIGSMKTDTELGDTILHVGGYIHYDAFNEAAGMPLKSHPAPYTG